MKGIAIFAIASFSLLSAKATDFLHFEEISFCKNTGVTPISPAKDQTKKVVNVAPTQDHKTIPVQEKKDAQKKVASILSTILKDTTFKKAPVKEEKEEEVSEPVFFMHPFRRLERN